MFPQFKKVTKVNIFLLVQIRSDILNEVSAEDTLNIQNGI